MYKSVLVIFCAAGILIPAASYSQYYYNQFASFDGVNDYFAAAPHSELNLDSAFTIEAWIFNMDTTGFNKTIMSTVSSSNNDGYAVLVQGSAANPGHAGKLQLNLIGSNYVYVQTAATRLALNGWSHFAISFQDVPAGYDTIRFYINGTLIQSFISIIGPLSSSGDSLRVGNCYIPNNYANGFRGRLDDLRIFKNARIASVIANDRGVPISFDYVSDINALAGTRYKALSASWTFNGTGNDYVGAFNNLTANNGAGFVNNSFNPENYRNQSNYYLRFPGVSWLSGPDVSNSNYDLDTAGTIEAWVYIDAYRTVPQTIVCKGTSAYSYILAISSMPSNSPAFILNSGSKYLQSTKPILPRVWTHIAATYKASTGLMQIFVNGVLDTSRPSTPGNIAVSNDTMFIGKSLFGEFMYGDMDEVRISKFEKSSPEINNYLYTNLDNLNYLTTTIVQSCFGFEGNTLDVINRVNTLIPRGAVFFERLNNTSGPAGASQAPLIRTSQNDPGFIGNSYNLNSRMVFVPNGTTVRDSILINSLTGSNRLNVLILMNHTNMTDVTLNLRAPNGVSINLTAATGGVLNDLMTVFDDYADSGISSTVAPFSMRIRPLIPLSNLPSTNLNGYWRLSVTDNGGVIDSGRVYKWGIKFIPFVGIINGNEIPGQFALYQNYPNPFNANTVISYQLSVNGFVALKVFDILGQEAAVLVNGRMRAGRYEAVWDGTNFPSGVYFCRLSAGDFEESRKMVLIK